jgi:glycerophosphoryl diester phosphodiesterase
MAKRAPLPPVVGHRGAAARAPENSLAGFRVAKALGVSCVEFDVRLTRDGVAVLFHDESLGRNSDGKGRIRSMDYDALRKRDVGAGFGPDYAGERIPTLAEALALLRALGLAFDLEMKAGRGDAEPLAERVAGALAEGWPATAPAPLVSSFERAAMDAIARRAPALARGYLVGALPRRWRAEAEALEACVVIMDQRHAGAAQIAAVKSAGYPLALYTVNDPAAAKAFFAQGVDSVISDAPDAILGLL